MEKLKNFVENTLFQRFILVVILFNSLLIGLETSADIMNSAWGPKITLLDEICLGIFVVELFLKIIVYNKRFLLDGWNIFDFVVVAISLMPNMQMFSGARMSRMIRIVRSFRAFRSLRMISSFHQLRVIIAAIVQSVMGILWISLLLLIIFYIFAIIGTDLFGAMFPEWFGSMGKSIYTLFQIMTLESWSMGICRPVMELYPWAWMYFVPFILISAFVMMNVVIGVVVSAVSGVTEQVVEQNEVVEDSGKKTAEETGMLPKIPQGDDKERYRKLQQEIQEMKLQLEKMEKLMQE